MKQEVRGSDVPYIKRDRESGLNKKIYPEVGNLPDAWARAIKGLVVELPETEEREIDGVVYRFEINKNSGVKPDYSDVKTTWERKGIARPSREEIFKNTVCDRDGGRVAFNGETFRIEKENPGFHARCALNGRAK